VCIHLNELKYKLPLKEESVLLYVYMRSKLNEFSMENAGQFIHVPVYQDA
jgi:hypothetical protein